MKKLLYLIITLFIFTACEDVIDLDVQEGVEQLVVDGWLTNKAEDQEIKLTISQPYFGQSEPTPALNAQVTIFEADSTAHLLFDLNNNGTYSLPKEQASFLKIGEQYALYINYEGEQYAAISKMNRTPKIDSINYEVFSFPIAPPDSSPQDGFIASFYSIDPEGVNDTYWIRTTKNNELFSDPAQLALSYDGGFSPSSQSDGLMFIPPIRQSINDGLYEHGDSIKVELWSIATDAYYFLAQVRTESSNGGIFATPPANIFTNITNLNDDSEKTALGFFGISAVSEFSIVVDSTKALPKQ